MNRLIAAIVLGTITFAFAAAQQVPDTAYMPPVVGPAYAPGIGRVVMSGEAAMFTAQVAGPQQFRAGMNSPFAARNYRLLLNFIHWLDGR